MESLAILRDALCYCATLGPAPASGQYVPSTATATECLQSTSGETTCSEVIEEDCCATFAARDSFQIRVWLRAPGYVWHNATQVHSRALACSA
jgi:hypothetical protein